MVVNAAEMLAGALGSAEICATWQMGQVASEPASLCQKEIPLATSTTAASAAVSAARCSHRRERFFFIYESNITPKRISNASTTPRSAKDIWFPSAIKSIPFLAPAIEPIMILSIEATRLLSRPKKAVPRFNETLEVRLAVVPEPVRKATIMSRMTLSGQKRLRLAVN
jgi:hypothetical protein